MVKHSLVYKAFTLMESLVTMVVLGVLFTLGYTLFDYAQAMYNTAINVRIQESEYIQFYTDVKESTFLSNGVVKYQDGVLINPNGLDAYKVYVLPEGEGGFILQRTEGEIKYDVRGKLFIRENLLIFETSDNVDSFVIPFTSYAVK